jgi:hypothetical protein
VIVAPEHYERWLGDEPDPRELMRPFSAELMRMWPVSKRVNKPENDDPQIIESLELNGVTRHSVASELGWLLRMHRAVNWVAAL